eukprot:11172153-Lingulodinium_polyedra.AAC.1
MAQTHVPECSALPAEFSLQQERNVEPVSCELRQPRPKRARARPRARRARGGRGRAFCHLRLRGK